MAIVSYYGLSSISTDRSSSIDIIGFVWSSVQFDDSVVKVAGNLGSISGIAWWPGSLGWDGGMCGIEGDAAKDPGENGKASDESKEMGTYEE